MLFLECDDAIWEEVGRLEQEIIELEDWLEEYEEERYLRQREFNRKLKRCDDLYHEVDELRRHLNREGVAQCEDSCSMTCEQSDEETLLYLTVGIE